MCEPWRKVWRDALAPVLSLAELSALRDALRADEPALIQGRTALAQGAGEGAGRYDLRPAAGACPIGYAGWKGLGLTLVGEVEKHFARVCDEIDRRAREPAACRWLLDFFDDTPRREMIALLLPEVERELEARR
jgi:hypothetical protein